MLDVKNVLNYFPCQHKFMTRCWSKVSKIIYVPCELITTIMAVFVPNMNIMSNRMLTFVWYTIFVIEALLENRLMNKIHGKMSPPPTQWLKNWWLLGMKDDVVWWTWPRPIVLCPVQYIVQLDDRLPKERSIRSWSLLVYSSTSPHHLWPTVENISVGLTLDKRSERHWSNIFCS